MTAVNVWDVGHGSCVSLHSDDGKLWLFDCGHGEFIRPSEFLLGDTIHRLTVLNLDHDHISDLANLARKFRIEVLTSNASISAPQLRSLKLESGPIGADMETLLSMMGGGGGGGPGLPVPPPQAAHVSASFFCNVYGVPFTETNNLSLVTILHTHGLHMVLPGDLEKPGWESLLRDARFQHELATVNVFMAPHHGRESGYCARVFDHCTPQLIVMSDCEKRYSTQEMRDTYAKHASGVWLYGRHRKVLTTRCDGSISFTAYGQQTLVDIAHKPALEAAFGGPALGLGIYGVR